MWAQSLPKHAAAGGVVPSASLPSYVAPTKPAPSAKTASKKGKEFISRPFNVKHNVHVAVDESSPTGFMVRAQSRPCMRLHWCRAPMRGA